jgi:hypothetical protein
MSTAMRHERKSSKSNAISQQQGPGGLSGLGLHDSKVNMEQQQQTTTTKQNIGSP